MSKAFLAIDLGADSGRVIYALLEGAGRAKRFKIQEVHRFATRGLMMHGVRQWDITRIYEEIVAGLTKAAQIKGPRPSGVAIDTWGVDFGFIAADGSLAGNPGHYRDARTQGMIEAAGSIIPQPEIYSRTGIMTLPFNTIYQLLAISRANAPVLKIADKLLFIGPLLGYLLTGKATCEYTVASTSQMLSAKTGEWDRELLGRLGISTGFLLPVTPSGTIVGGLRPEIVKETGLPANVPFISTAVHDTACAVAAVPVAKAAKGKEKNWAYLSSGTWSLIGAEISKPVIGVASRAASFTNEGGVGGTYRFLKNIFGLWLVQECRRSWVAEAKGKEKGLDYATLVKEAGKAEPFRSVIPLDDPRLFAPEHMPRAIEAICKEKKISVPKTKGQFIRCCVESLALSYRKALGDMDGLLGRKTEILHIVGGGVKDQMLCQLTADACGIPVEAGPVEGTALGNVLVQALAVGAFKSLAEGREAIRASQKIALYKPRGGDEWKVLAKKVYG